MGTSTWQFPGTWALAMHPPNSAYATSMGCVGPRVCGHIRKGLVTGEGSGGARTRVRTARRSARVEARVLESASLNIAYIVVISSSSLASAKRCASTNATAALKLRWLQIAALMNDDSMGSARALSAASCLRAKRRQYLSTVAASF